MMSNATALAMVLAIANASGESGLAPTRDGEVTREAPHSQQKTLAVNGVPYYVDSEIAVGALGDELLAHGIYLFHLRCSSDLYCSLDRILLNECVRTKNGDVNFIPRVDNWSTSPGGRLDVKQVPNNELALIVYQAFGNQLPAKISLTFDTKGPAFRRLIGFKRTGFIDGRLRPDITTRVEYMPVQGDRKKTLDCPVFLHGLN
jgi:hypothetical protein